jgi:hypothetical protein
LGAWTLHVFQSFFMIWIYPDTMLSQICGTTICAREQT